MDEQHLDRTIDTAARQLVAREPGAALRANVMARVRGDGTGSPRRLVWAAAAATIFVCLASASVWRLLQPLPVLPSLPPHRPLAIAEPNTTVDRPTIAANDERPARRTDSTPHSRRVPYAPLPVDMRRIEPLVSEPIFVAAIDVPRLESEPPAIVEALTIDELTIEPLAASND